jgi:nitrous oxidase accessory protein NosD
VIRNNTIVGQGELPASERSDGIILTDAPGALVELNTVLRVRDAVRLEAAPGGAVRGNLVQDGWRGLVVVGSAGVTATFNTFDGLETAVSGRYANGFAFERNTIINSRSAGIILEASADWRVEANLLAHNQRGLAIGAASSGTVRQNRFNANRLAVDVAPVAHAVQVRGNDFIGNRTTVADDPPAASVWSGNYWGRFARISLDATPARRPVAVHVGVHAASDAPALPWPTAALGSAGVIGVLLISFTLRRRRTSKPKA